MLRLHQIILTHFKNYSIRRFQLDKKIVGICGLNGIGKTNLLDAVYYSSFTKSYFSVTDALNVQLNQEGFRIEAHFNNSGVEQNVVCIHRNAQKKECFLNDVPYEKLAAHIGLIPTVMIAPDDIDIITGASEKRRRYIDTTICQMDSVYLSNLMKYNKILQQRNSHLKQEAVSGNTNDSLLDIFDDQLKIPGRMIHEKRVEYTKALLPIIHQFYQNITSTHEQVDIAYESELNNQSIDTLLSNNRRKDRAIQRTSSGIHKDDLTATMQGQPFKNIASQGQRKSLLFAMKLAEYEMIKQNKGFAPILLLDDVFEKLDDVRMNNLLDWVCNKNDGQVLITDTHLSRLTQAFEQLDIDAQIIELQ